MKDSNKLFFFTYLVTIAYDGSAFFGWAKQPKMITAQGYIEKTIQKIFNQKIKILATSRTDKGVHALEQKFTFRLNFELSEKIMFKILNRKINYFVLIKKVKKVINDFNPIHEVKKKEYRYFINLGKNNLFKRKYQWEYNFSLEEKKINKILKTFQGKHDFFNFSHCSYKEQKKTNTIREINYFKASKKGDILIIRIISKGFLRYQIRALIGETIDCYEGKKTIDELKNKLNNPTLINLKYRRIAPAEGLYLWKINFKTKI